jgi:hypothetical protein
MDSDDGEAERETVKPPAEKKRSGALKELERAWLIGAGPALAAFSDDERHRRKCKQGPCTRCNYVDRGPELAKLTPMLPPDTLDLAGISADKLQAAKGCWLASATVDGVWGLGCIACCARSLPGPFGAFSWNGAGSKGTLKAHKLLKHGASAEHQTAVAAYFGIASEALTSSPASSELLEQLQSLQQGRAGNRHSKAQTMTWCLREALLDIDREFVRKAQTLTICRDDRAQRLLMRYTGATADLEVRSGVLGIGTAHRDRPDADGIVAATQEVCEAFCTPRRGAPIHGAGPKNVDAAMDVKLLTHLREIIEVIAVDEEAAEVKAADIGRGRRASALELQPITPNLKFVTRDKAHGFRRQSE